MNSGHVSLLAITVPMAGIVGLFVGSFLNVVIYRTPLGLSVSTPRSFCPTCDRQLTWWENIPVLSWLCLRGRCHSCQEPISIRYPLVELVTGVTFALTTWAWHGTVVAAGYCVLAATFIAVSLIDYGGRKAPTSVVAIGTGLAEVIIIGGAISQHRGAILVGSLVGLGTGLVAYVLLGRADRPGADQRHRGAGILLVAGCWLGGLGPLATLVGASLWIVVYAGCMAGSWVLSRETVGAGDGMIGIGHPRPITDAILGTPLVTAVAIAMVASLAVGA